MLHQKGMMTTCILAMYKCFLHVDDKLKASLDAVWDFDKAAVFPCAEGSNLSAGSGAAEPTSGQHGCEGLRPCLPGLHLQIHFRQLPRALLPAHRPGERDVHFLITAFLFLMFVSKIYSDAKQETMPIYFHV